MPSFAELFEFSSTGLSIKLSPPPELPPDLPDLVLLLLFLYVLYKLFFKRHHVELAPGAAESPAVAPLPKQDMTVDQLARFNGVDDEHICLAICGKAFPGTGRTRPNPIPTVQIFDVTKGKDFYGPGGAYGGKNLI